jgi:hypothetical protein
MAKVLRVPSGLSIINDGAPKLAYNSISIPTRWRKAFNVIADIQERSAAAACAINSPEGGLAIPAYSRDSNLDAIIDANNAYEVSLS